MRNIYTILVSVLFALVAGLGSAKLDSGVEIYSDTNDSQLVAYNAVEDAVEYVSETSRQIIVPRLVSGTPVLRNIESRRIYDPLFKLSAVSSRSKTSIVPPLSTSTGIQSVSVLECGVKTSSRLLYYLETIII